jgi:hypothetical protein
MSAKYLPKRKNRNIYFTDTARALPYTMSDVYICHDIAKRADMIKGRGRY